ncbi:MAG: hypothetical protein ABFQ65_01540 [Nanoarchaeota archaeon]
MEISNEKIYEKLIGLELQIQALNRANKSNKFQFLEQEVKNLERVEVSKVQSILGGISRPWALNLMKKLGKENHFQFVPGNRQMKRPSLIVYEEAKAKKEKYDKIKSFVNKNGIVSFAQICEYLNLELNDKNLEIIKIIINGLIRTETEYEIEGGNKLHKITVNKKVVNRVDYKK